MATTCGKLYNGQDLSCEVFQKGYFQEMVLVNMDDIETIDINRECGESNSSYSAGFTLKEGASGVRFQGPSAGNAMRGSFSMTRNDFKVAEYEHVVHALISGVNQEQKCILHNLDKGRVVAIAKIRKPSGDDVLEVFGLGEGLITDDYEYDVVEGGGIVDITLHSDEDALESDLPYIYEPAEEGDALLDFENLFVNE